MIKKISAVAVSFLIACLFTLNTFALNIKPTDSFFVNDYADVLSDEAENEIMNLGVQLQKLTDAQIVVVTVDTIGSEDLRTCAGDIARDWGIGDAEKDNGILIFLAVKERNYSIEIGYGLEGAIPDVTSSRIQRDVMNPYFTNDNFSDGMVAGYRKLCALVYNEYGIEMPSELENEDYEYLKEEDSNTTFNIIATIILLIIAFSFAGLRRRRFIRFGPGAFFGGGFSNGGNGGNSGNGGSGFGGGGGGGFSGGGGGFGGGGSSSGF